LHTIDRQAWRSGSTHFSIIARALRASAALAAVLLLTTPVAATTIRKLRLEEVVAAADTVVHGRVEKVDAFWDGRQLYTEVTLRVDRGLKGARADRVAFVQLGGTVMEPVPITVTVPGAPIHRVGDEGFYFLEPGSPGRHVLVGLNLGRVPVLQGPQGAFVAHGGRKLAPADFEEEIRRIIAGQVGQANRPAESAGSR
jgi:hypothetical protein